MSLLPVIEPTVNGAILRLDDGTTHHLRTTVQCDQLLKLIYDARKVIEQQIHDRGSRLDRDVAAAMNEANEKAHRRYGKTLRGWPPAPVQRIPITACECTRTVLCEEHSGGAA